MLLQSEWVSSFTTGGLPPISLSRRQAHWDPWTEIFFLSDWTLSAKSPYATSSLTRRWVCLLWTCLTFHHVYVSHIQHVIENVSFCTIHKSSVNIDFTEQIMSILRILCYNGSLVIWTVVSLTTANFNPRVCCVWLHFVRYREDVHSHDFCYDLRCPL
jgi:hypothetical protein